MIVYLFPLIIELIGFLLSDHTLPDLFLSVSLRLHLIGKVRSHHVGTLDCHNPDSLLFVTIQTLHRVGV